MKNSGYQICAFLLIVFLGGCFEPPEFPNEPHIRFKSLSFLDYETERDSLILSFEFEDGDGDIGLTSNETFYPYQDLNFVIDSRDSLVTFSGQDFKPPFYLVSGNPNVPREFFSDTDNRPSYNCSDYQFGTIRGFGTDTFYVQQNEYHNNLHIEFLRKVGDDFVKINFAEEFGNANCDVVDFNGRIPIFDGENLGSSLSGTINYSLLSLGFPFVLRRDTFKVRFYIYDRALNKSNVVESPELTLEQITTRK